MEYDIIRIKPIAPSLRSERNTISSLYSDTNYNSGRPDSIPEVNYALGEDIRVTDPTIDAILSYFEKKTGGTRMPRRADVSPAELKPYLPDICIMEPHYSHDGRVENVTITLQGTSAVSFYGEMTGQLVTSHPSPEVGERIIRSAQKCVDCHAPVAIIAQALSKTKQHLKVIALYVPLSHDNKTINKFFVHVRVMGSSADSS